MKKKKKKEVLLPSRMLHYTPRKELDIHHQNVESNPCSGKEHPSQIECLSDICPSRIPNSLSCKITIPQDVALSGN
jgi:hypothetical protein